MPSYSNNDFKAQCIYPERWQVEYREDSDFIYPPRDNPSDAYRDGVIIYRPKESSSSLTYISEKELEFAEAELNGYEFVSNNPSTLSSSALPARTIEYTFNHPRFGLIKRRQLIHKKGAMVYRILYTAQYEPIGGGYFNTHLNGFNQMVQSWRFTST